MTTSQSTNAADASPARNLSYVARYYLAGWRGVSVLAVIAALVGIGFSWSWLVAAGLVPILISVLPCLVMCAFGVCMLCRSSDEQSMASHDAADAATSPPAPAVAKLDGSPATASNCCQGGEGQSFQVRQAQSIEERRDSHA